MPLPTNALTAPLGQNAPRPAEPPRRFRSAGPALIVGSLSAALLAFGAFALIAEDPLGGEPVVRVAAKVKPVPVLASVQPTAEPVAAAQPPAAMRQSINIINGSTGQRQQYELGAPIMAQRPPPAAAAPEPAGGNTRIDISSGGEVRITPAEGKEAAEIKRYMQSAQRPPAPAGAKVINLPR